MNVENPQIASLLSAEEYAKWRALGERILGFTPQTPCPCDSPAEAFYTAFCQAGSSLLEEGSYHHLENWADLGLEIAGRSLPTATEFFRSTPTFICWDSVFRIRTWASGVMQLLTIDSDSGAPPAFFRSSAKLLQFMTFRELREWTRTGITLARKSSPMAEAYFSLVPDGLDQLYSTEWLRICKIGALLAKDHPEEVLELFEASPQLLIEMSPAVRNTVLEAAKLAAQTAPATVNGVLRQIVSTLKGLLYPTQELVLDSHNHIAEISPLAAERFMTCIGLLLEDMHDTFLPMWIGRGIEILNGNAEEGVRYFSLQSGEAEFERAKWGNAVLLDDLKFQLSLFAHALSGKRLALGSTEEAVEDVSSETANYPRGDGERIYLPSSVSSEESKTDNTRLYRVAAAHQAGYIACGTFEEGLNEIISHLASLPSADLAKDIFYILEDGRVDRMLGQEYPGLKVDLEAVLTSAMKRRPAIAELPRQGALVEALLRQTTGHLDPDCIPQKLVPHARAIQNILEPAYEKASNVWDTYALARRIFDYIHQLSDGATYERSIPVAYRGQPDPELIPDPGPYAAFPTAAIDAEGSDHGILPMPLEELRALVEKTGVPDDLEFQEQESLGGEGLFVSDLSGIKTASRNKEPDPYTGDEKRIPFIRLSSGKGNAAGPFYYDEWDYLAGTYRKNWCRLHEEAVEPVRSDRVSKICETYRDLIQKVRKQFQRIRPDILELVRRVEWGDDLDFPAMVQGVVERKAGTSPSDKVFTRREKKLRQIATLFLMDMSASTSELVPAEGEDGLIEKKIIDIEIEGLVVLLEALEALSDRYGIFGFSGYGRKQVDFYRIKDFSDDYSEELKHRICGIEPKQGTRMGPAIRHAIGKLRNVEADQRILLLLSDGYPQDHDYGEDRRSNDYGLHDTMMALLEAKKEGIRPFCITADQSGNDYLRKMCDPTSYLVIKDIHTLPEILPKVVESLMD